MLRAVFGDVGDGFVHAVDGFNGDDGVEEFLAVVVGRGRFHAGVAFDGGFVAAHFAASVQ